MKIGCGIVTCNRPDMLKVAYESLWEWEPYYPDEYDNPLHYTVCDELVIVNDGDELPVIPYSDPDDQTFNLPQDLKRYFNIHYIKNETNIGVGKSKNKALQHLLDKGCDYIFIMEDDMVIKNKDIFEAYIDASKITGIQHFMFGYHGPANKGGISGGKPLPKSIIDYGKLKIALNQHCVGAFCFYTKESLEMTGLYDENYLNAFEHVDHSYELAKNGYSTPYWNWADLANSCDYIEEQECSEKSSSIRPRQDWIDNIQKASKYFYEKHGYTPVGVPETSREDVIKFLKNAKGNSQS